MHPAVDFLFAGEPSGRSTIFGTGAGQPDLRTAIVLYNHKERALWLDRPQAGERRGTLFSEVLVMDAAAAQATEGRPLRLLGLFASQPSPEQARRTERLVSSGSGGPQAGALGQLLSPRFEHAASCRQMLARVLAHCTENGPEAHLAVVLPEDKGHLALPLAIALDELLPPTRKQRGFAFSTVLVKGASDGPDPKLSLYESRDWTIFPEEEKKRRFGPLSPQQVCDLRSPPERQDATAEAFERLLARGGELVAGFFDELVRRLQNNGMRGDLAEVPAEHWARLGIELAAKNDGSGMSATHFANTLNWRTFRWHSFLEGWKRMGPHASLRSQVLEKLIGWAQECPPMLAWLVHAEVRSPDPQRVARALEKVFQGDSDGGTE